MTRRLCFRGTPHVCLLCVPTGFDPAFHSLSVRCLPTEKSGQGETKLEAENTNTNKYIFCRAPTPA